MNPLSKLLVSLGVVLILAGLFWQLGARHLPLGRLPGDIVIKKENFSFYFPITTSLLISFLLSLIVYLIRIFRKS